MPRFVFRLATLLKARQARERSHQQVVAQIERERLGLEEQVRLIQRAIDVEKVALRDQLMGGAGGAGGGGLLDLRAARYQATASLRLTARAQHVVLLMAGAHARLEAARAELIEATTARRAVELLRDRQYEEFVAQAKRTEFAMLDELMVMRGGRAGDDAEHTENPTNAERVEHAV